MALVRLALACADTAGLVALYAHAATWTRLCKSRGWPLSSAWPSSSIWLTWKHALSLLRAFTQAFLPHCIIGIFQRVCLVMPNAQSRQPEYRSRKAKFPCSTRAWLTGDTSASAHGCPGTEYKTASSQVDAVLQEAACMSQVQHKSRLART